MPQPSDRDDPADHPRLLLVTEQPIFRNGFAAMLNVLRPRWRMDCAGRAVDALALVIAQSPNVVLIDTALRDDQAHGLVRQLSNEHASLKLLLIADHEQQYFHARARFANVCGMVARTLMPEDVVALVERALLGKMSCEDDARAPFTLTDRQQEVLDLLAKGFANKEIQFRLNLAERTVRAHLTDLFHQLNVQGRMQAVIRARELGLLA